MKEWMVWTIIVACAYFAAYLLVSCTVVTMWRSWAARKTNMFLRYNLMFEVKRSYPGYYWFSQNHHGLYNMLYVCAWPVMVPLQLCLLTKSVYSSLRRVSYY